MDYSYQLAWHVDTASWPDWGSAPRGNLVRLDRAHQGEWLDSVIGPDPATGKETIYHILKCEYCVTIHCWPLPSPEALAQYYATQFFQHEKPEYIERYERDRVWWEECVHRPLLCKAVANCDRGTRLMQEPVQVLEVGAGPGIALDVAASYGWSTYAVEPSPLCAERLRKQGHWVYEGSLESYAATAKDLGRQFDILYLYEVLEHQPSPSDFLHECLHLTKPGGIIIICVPNDASNIQYQVCAKLGIPPYWWAPPQHLHYFSPKFLQLMVRWAGYDVLDMRGTYPLERFILDEGQNYLGNDAIGRKVHQWRMQDELFALRSGLWQGREQQYRRQMEEQRWGREIVCIAQRPY